MVSRLKLKPDEIYQFYAEIRWEALPDLVQHTNMNIRIDVKYPPEYSVDSETAKQLNKFCFPTGQPTFSSTDRFCFVLTDQDGLFRFGFCRYDTIRRCCMFLLSYLPWFDCFYSFLLMLQGYISCGEKDGRKSFMPSLLLERLHSMSLPLPEASFVSLSCSKGSLSLQEALTTPQDPLAMLPSLPIPSTFALPQLKDCQNIQLLYSLLPPDTILSVFASLLQERRIILFSHSLTNLTAVIHGFNQLLYPLFWQHIFIPVLPDGLTDYCCAPMPFLCGVPAQLMPRVRQLPLEDVVLLDIDQQQLESPFSDQAQIPKEILQPLLYTLKKPASRIDHSIPEAFVHFFAVTLGGYRSGMKQYEDKVVFDQDLFLKSQPAYIHSFLTILFQLQMFDQFVASRTFYVKNYTDDPFEQECRNLKENAHKTASQKFVEFGDKITDAKDNFVTKFKELEIIRSSDIKSSTNDMFKQANTNIKNLRGFINKRIKSTGIPSLITKPKALQSDTLNINAENALTSSITSNDMNEIERQYSTMGKRHSAIVLKPKQEILFDIKRPDRPPPPIPLPYSKHLEAKSTQTNLTPTIPDALPPPLPHKRSKTLHNEMRQEVNLISFDCSVQTNLYFVPLPQQQQQQQQQLPPNPLPRKYTNPLIPPSYGFPNTTTTKTTAATPAHNDLLLIKPTTETNLDDLIPNM